MNPAIQAYREKLIQFRSYLRLLADTQLSPALRAKLSASDIVQQALLQAHRDLEQFQGKTDVELAGWLRQILMHTLLDALRQFKTQARNVKLVQSLEAELEASSLRLERWLASKEPSPSKQAVQKEQDLALTRALAQLPEEQRLAVELKHLQSLPLETVSQRLGRSEASVAGLLRRGLARLRKLLAEPS